jgi:hypothetical protein
MDAREANLKKTIWKLASGLHSLIEAGAIAEARNQMGTSASDAVHDGMMNAITTLYCRPFTDNGGVGVVSEKIARNLTEDSRSTHSFVWRHRNHTAAHSDATVRYEGEERLIRDLTMIVTKLPYDGTQIGHSLPFVRIELGHLPSFIVLIGEMIELFHKALDENIGHLYWDEENSCPKPTMPDLSHLQVGDSLEFPLNLHEALAKEG